MPKEEIGLETSKKQTMTQGEFLLPFAPACPPDTGLRDFGHRPVITPLPWRIPLKLGNVGHKYSLRKRRHRLLNFPSYAFPHRLPRFLMRLRLGSRADGGKAEMADRAGWPGVEPKAYPRGRSCAPARTG